jgi:hypothetical protein
MRHKRDLWQGRDELHVLSAAARKKVVLRCGGLPHRTQLFLFLFEAAGTETEDAASKALAIAKAPYR